LWGDGGLSLIGIGGGMGAAIGSAAGVDISHVIDYAGSQSSRLPGIAAGLGSAASEAGGLLKGRMMDALKRALAKTAEGAV
jgi:hypothetical protein